MKKYVLISGTEKSGTTSLYQYMVDSGFFNESIKKETDFFRDVNCEFNEYEKEFRFNIERSLFLEGSPGYLADSNIVADNIAEIQSYKDKFELIFILRSPLERLKSSFLFHKSRLYLDKNMSFDKYISMCFEYENGKSATAIGLDEWFLRVLDSGLYSKHLDDFEKHEINMMVFEFREFCVSPNEVVNKVFNKLGLDSSFYSEYNFEKSNVTSGHKNDFIQRAALVLNKRLESFFYSNPKVKKLLLSIYSRLNGAEKEKIDISLETRARLKEFYEQDIVALVDKALITDSQSKKWLDDFNV
jgi:hypothetical protein